MWKQRPFTIKRKLLLINAVIAIVPLLIIGAIIAGIYQNTVDKRTKQSVTDSSVVIADRITRVLKDTESCSNYLTININEVLKEKDPLEKINLRKQRDVTNELYNAKIVFDEMESIAFISDSNQIFVSDNAMLKNAEIVKDSEQFEQLKETSGKSIWFPCETREFLVLDKEKPVVTLGKKVVKITTGETLGYILINVNMEQLESVLRNQLIHYRLEDSTGKQVCSVPATENISAKYIEDIIRSVGEYKTGIYEGKNYYVTSYNIAEYGWKLTSVADLYTLNVGAK
ncbi:cache domain-containing protein [Anaerosporobacter faecicola]|uniref:cache domain-containing protein n=1 Tax=Anaerosporobacter faecicola TaxID=2718714 RepID=UPI001EE5F925|nr:cache domain-containing protein [Anaerosporobacter faecicola]